MQALVMIGQWFTHYGIGLIVVVLSFGFIIFIHELGHFLMAKRVGVRVHEFALGFGPQLIMIRPDSEKKWHYFFPLFKKMTKEDEKALDETEYSLRLFPLGGYVKMEGEDTPCEDVADSGNFQNKSVWDRIKIVASGPLMNYMTALLIFWFVGFVYGTGELYLQPKIGKLLEGKPAMQAGFQVGDIILSIDGKKIKDAREMVEVIHRSPDKDLVIEAQRGTEVFTRTVRTYVLSEGDEKIGLIGFAPDTRCIGIRFNRVPAGTVITDGFDQMKRFTVAPFYAIALMVKGKMPAREVKEGSAGPIGIGQMFFELYHKGFSSLLYFLGIINVLIGFFNLIPFPALDGSRVLILGVSGLIKKPINQEKEGMVHLVGFILLLGVVVFVTYFDIVRLVKGVNFFK